MKKVVYFTLYNIAFLFTHHQLVAMKPLETKDPRDPKTSTVPAEGAETKTPLSLEPSSLSAEAAEAKKLAEFIGAIKKWSSTRTVQERIQIAHLVQSIKNALCDPNKLVPHLDYYFKAHQRWCADCKNISLQLIAELIILFKELDKDFDINEILVFAAPFENGSYRGTMLLYAIHKDAARCVETLLLTGINPDKKIVCFDSVILPSPREFAKYYLKTSPNACQVLGITPDEIFSRAPAPNSGGRCVIS